MPLKPMTRTIAYLLKVGVICRKVNSYVMSGNNITPTHLE